jgi:hypothetical protein
MDPAMAELLDWETDWFAAAVLASDTREAAETEGRIRMLLAGWPDLARRFYERLGERLELSTVWSACEGFN